MSAPRSGLAELVLRWREALIWAAVLAVGAVLLLRGIERGAPGLTVLGLLAAGAGLFLTVGAVQRVRLRPDAEGPGVVRVDEGRIGYLGPRDGGYVDLARLTRVELGSEAWILTAEDGAQLVIPRGALGAEALPDALEPLPGLDLAAARALPKGGPVTLWLRAGEEVPAERRLH